MSENDDRGDGGAAAGIDALVEVAGGGDRPDRNVGCGGLGRAQVRDPD